MKNICFCIFCICYIKAVSAADSLSVSSPDKSIQVSVKMDNAISYTVSRDKKMIVLPSVIDLTMGDGKKMSDLLSIQSKKITAVDQVITAAVPVQRKTIPDQYNELTIQLKQPFNLIFRVYNDGVAYRIATRFKDSVVIKNETSGSLSDVVSLKFSILRGSRI